MSCTSIKTNDTFLLFLHCVLHVESGVLQENNTNIFGHGPTNIQHNRVSFRKSHQTTNNKCHRTATTTNIHLTTHNVTFFVGPLFIYKNTKMSLAKKNAHFLYLTFEVGNFIANVQQ